MRALKGVSELPVLVGFGIKDPGMARSVAAHADGVVVGSVLVNTMFEAAAKPDTIPARLRSQVGEIRAALDE